MLKAYLENDLADALTEPHKDSPTVSSSVDGKQDDMDYRCDDDEPPKKKQRPFGGRGKMGDGTLKPSPSPSAVNALEKKREYNRNNAARFRQRRKEMMESLQVSLKETTELLEEERQTSARLRMQVEALLQVNRELATSISGSGPSSHAGLTLSPNENLRQHLRLPAALAPLVLPPSLQNLTPRQLAELQLLELQTQRRVGVAPAPFGSFR